VLIGSISDAALFSPGGDGVPVLKVHMPLEPWLTVELAISSVVANGFTARSNSSSFFE
jgi:hypothetical protein